MLQFKDMVKGCRLGPLKSAGLCVPKIRLRFPFLKLKFLSIGMKHIEELRTIHIKCEGDINLSHGTIKLYAVVNGIFGVLKL